jgi:hypothetical protein
LKSKIILTGHKTMNYKYLLSIFFILNAAVLSFASGSYLEIPKDTLPSTNPDYKGYRLAITDFSVDRQMDWVNVQFTAINTGRKDIILSKNDSKSLIVLNLDELSSNLNFEKYKNVFIKKLLKSDLEIKAGDALHDRQLKINANNLPAEVEKDMLPAKIPTVEQNDHLASTVATKGISENIKDDSNCSDLIIESISIVKKSKNAVTLKYKIKNQGKLPVSITGKTKSKEDNLAITIHMSSSEKLTRGSIAIGATFLKNEKQIPDGKLYPGKSLTEEIKIDIRSMTRFTPIIILEIDPYLSVQECNETNNLNHIKVKEGDPTD